MPISQIKKASNTCDAALEGFTGADKWLGTDPAGHLFDGLTYLLQAAQEWQCQRDLRLQLGGTQVQVYAMDSVFLRARSLFEFFMGKGRDNYCHARCLFGLADQLSCHRYGRDVNDEAVLTPPADHGNPFARASASPAAGFAPSVPSVAATTSVGSCFSLNPPMNWRWLSVGMRKVPSELG